MEKSDFIDIDGGYGEGGGQILRTALTLSGLTGRPVHVFRVRAKRRRPGLMSQHLTALNALAKVCHAETKGVSIGSQELWFIPRKSIGGNYTFDVAQLRPSAGSVSLIFQTVLPALLYCGKPSRIKVRGGTHIPASPPHEFIEWAFIPFMARMGARLRCTLNKPGFYPSGGGETDFAIEPLNRSLRPIVMTERGPLASIQITTLTSGLDNAVAERMCGTVQERIAGRGVPVEALPRHYSGNDKASFSCIHAHFANIDAAFGVLGRGDDDPQAIATETAARLISFLGVRNAVEEHLADQVVLYLLLAEGKSVISVPRITSHILTNIWVAGQFFPGRIKVDGILDDSGSIHVDGVGLTPEMLSSQGTLRREDGTNGDGNGNGDDKPARESNGTRPGRADRPRGNGRPPRRSPRTNPVNNGTNGTPPLPPVPSSGRSPAENTNASPKPKRRRRPWGQRKPKQGGGSEAPTG